MKSHKYVAMCSGGKDSVATLITAQKMNEPLDEVVFVEVMFDENTSAEHPRHIEFIHKILRPWVEKQFNVPFTILRSGISYKDIFYRVIGERGKEENRGKLHGFVIPGRCWLNGQGKLMPIRKWLKAESEKFEVTQYIGLAADERGRIDTLRTRWKDGAVSLLDKYDITERMTWDICIRRNLLSPVYDYASRSGCWCCPNCSDSQLWMFRKQYPELWSKFLELGHVQGVAHPDFRYNETILQAEERFKLRESRPKLFDTEQLQGGKL